VAQQRSAELLHERLQVGTSPRPKTQLAGERQHQSFGLEQWVGEVGADVGVVQCRHESAAEHGLAGADFAGDLGEPFAAAGRDQQGIQRLLVGGAGEGIAGVGRDAEWQLAKAEVDLIHWSTDRWHSGVTRAGKRVCEPRSGAQSSVP
jgi:hypothetical protein